MEAYIKHGATWLESEVQPLAGTSLVLEVEVSSDEEDDILALPESQNVFNIINQIE